MSSWASFSSQVKKRKEPVPDDQALQASSSAGRKQKESKISNLGTSSSFLSLKAELAGRKADVKQGSSNDGILDKRERKLPTHLRPAPDVLARSLKHDRNQTTSSWANTPSSQLDATRRALERKAAMYEKLKRGETGGLDEQSFQDSLIDWDRKEYENGRESSESESSQEEQSCPLDSDEDPLTEYEDDLGRMRKVRRSQVPRSALKVKKEEKEEETNEELVTYGAATSFPVFKPDPIRRAQAQKAEAYKRRGVDHFDAEYEKRYRGAGFYQFSQDEETRKKQMEALRADRDETERARAEMSSDEAKMSLGERRREERRKVVAQKRAEIEEKRRRYAEKHGGSAPLEEDTAQNLGE